MDGPENRKNLPSRPDDRCRWKGDRADVHRGSIGAEKYIAVLVEDEDAMVGLFAVNSDEIDALRVWREFVENQQTAGRDVPALRDVFRTSIERLKEGATTTALEILRAVYEGPKSLRRSRHAISPP